MATMASRNHHHMAVYAVNSGMAQAKAARLVNGFARLADPVAMIPLAALVTAVKLLAIMMLICLGAMAHDMALAGIGRC